MVAPPPRGVGNPGGEEDPEDDSVIDDLVRAYLEARERGESPDREEFLRRHPEQAEQLAEFFASEDSFEGVAPPAQAAERASPELLLPARVGPYEIIDELAQGGMGVVVRARHVALGRTDAVKLLLGGGLIQREARERFRREAETLASLDHEGIVPVHDVGEEAGVPWFAMKLIDGSDLSQTEPLSFSAREAAELIARVARAVDHAHKRGVLHRDLKPANIVLDSEGQPLVTDFGLAKHIVSEDPDLTREGAVVGTAKYLAPELAREGSTAATIQTDVYALGMILYEVLTGRVAFEGSTALEIMRHIVDDDPQPPGSIRPGIAPDLEAICLESLAKSPDDRYRTAGEFAEDLERFLDGRPVRARPEGPWPRSLRWMRRHPRTAGMLWLALLLVLATVVGSLLIARREHQHALELEERDRFNRRYAYAKHLQLAYAAWRDGRPGDALAALESQRPEAGRVDHRDFPWFHLHALLHLESDSGGLSGLPKSGTHTFLSLESKRFVNSSKQGVGVWDLTRNPARKIAEYPGQLSANPGLSPRGTRLALPRGLAVELIDLGLAEAGSEADRLRIEAGETQSLWVTALAFAADGRELLTGHKDGSLRSWNIETGEPLAVLRAAGDRHPLNLAVSADGSRIAIVTSLGQRRHELTFYDPRCGKIVATGTTEGHGPMCFSPDGAFFAFAENLGPKYSPAGVRIFDGASGAPLRAFDHRIFELRRLTFTPDSRELVVARFNGEVCVWNVLDGTRIVRLRGQEGLLDLALNSTGFATVGIDGRLRTWDRARIIEPRSLGYHRSEVWHLGLAPTAPYLVSADLDYVAWVAAIEEGAQLRGETVREFGSTYTAGAISPRGTLVAGGKGRHLELRRAAPGQEASFELLWESGDFEPRDLEFSGDGRRLAVLEEGRLGLLALDDGPAGLTAELARTFDLRALGVGRPRRLSLSADGRLIFLLASSSRVYHLDVERTGLAGTTDLELGAASYPCRLAVSPDAKHFLCGYMDGSIRIWSIEVSSRGVDLEPRTTLKHGGKEIWAFAFPPGNPAALVSGSDDGTIVFWDLLEGPTGTIGLERASLDAHRGGVKDLVFSSDGETLYSAGGENHRLGEILIWRAPRP